MQPATRSPASRIAEISRATSETDIQVRIDLDGQGQGRIATGIGFLDHMLTALCRHSLIDMDIAAKGDLHIDFHHTTEDVGIVLGQAVRQALGEKRGIRRYGHALVPMDEALVEPRSTSPAAPSWPGARASRATRWVRWIPSCSRNSSVPSP
jgi:imidazoleglycerol-phosphate dehydratase